MLKRIRHALRVAAAKRREKKKLKTRSPQWDHVRDAFIKIHQACAACGDKKNLQVHHKKPFHLHPELELDPNNLIALCMGLNECHLTLGHGDSFKCYNPNIERDAKAFMTATLALERKDIQIRAKKNRMTA